MTQTFGRFAYRTPNHLTLKPQIVKLQQTVHIVSDMMKRQAKLRRKVFLDTSLVDTAQNIFTNEVELSCSRRICP
jgi:hypothetical protein